MRPSRACSTSAPSAGRLAFEPRDTHKWLKSGTYRVVQLLQLAWPMHWCWPTTLGVCGVVSACALAPDPGASAGREATGSPVDIDRWCGATGGAQPGAADKSGCGPASTLDAAVLIDGPVPPGEGDGWTDPPARSLVLATWNLKWLAAHDDWGPTPRTADQRAALRSQADRVNADIWVFQELQGSAAAHSLLDEDEYAVAFPDDGDLLQTGVAWRHSLALEEVRIVEELAFTGGRSGIQVVLDLAGAELWLLGLHLESGCFGPEFDDSADCRRLAQQLAWVADWIALREARATDWVVLGDFNRHLTEAGVFWSQLRRRHADLCVADEGLAVRCHAGRWPLRVDHIVYGGRLRGLSVGDWSFPTEWSGEWVPDHCPLSIEVESELHP